MMLLLAVLLALAPEPSLGPGDDFNEVVAKMETANDCKAVSIVRKENDALREVLFRCEEADFRAVLIYAGDLGWFPMGGEWVKREKPKGSDI